MTPSIRTPKAGEVWESSDGKERRLVVRPSVDACLMAYWGLDGPKQSSSDEWLGWTIRTNARCILEARNDA